jgi:hypothetical protein
MNLRWPPLTGVVFVILIVISFILSGETPDFDDTGEEVISFYTDNEGSQMVSAVLGAYAALFFIFFASLLRAELRRNEEGPGVLSTISFAGAVVFAVGGLAFAGFTFTLADLADESPDPGAMQALNALNGEFFFPVAVGMGAFLLGAGIATVRGGVLSTWIGWAAVVIGVLAVTPAGFFAFLAGLAWVLVVSIMLAREPASPGAAPPPPSPGAAPPPPSPGAP